MINVFIRIRNFLIEREFTKFLLVGLINTGLSYAVYLLLNIFLPYKAAYSMAYFAGFVCSYLLNTRWVFQTRVSWKSFFSFPLVYVAQLFINLVCLHILIEELFVSEQIAPLLVIVLSVPITFLLSRYVIKPSAG